MQQSDQEANNYGSGWVRVYRSILDHKLWKEKPYTKAQAFLWLVLQVNYKDSKALIGMHWVECKRGQMITSQLKLAEAWGWGRDKVRAYIDLLQSDAMLTHQSTQQYTIITICNYDTYQSVPPTVPTTKPQRTLQQNRNGSDTNKEVKEVKKEKDIYVEYINLINTLLTRQYKGDKKSRAQFEARIREGYTIENFRVAITAGSQDDFHRNQCQPQYKYLTPEFFSRPDKLEMFMNRGPKIIQMSQTAGPDLRGYTVEQIIDLAFIKDEDLGYIMTIRPAILKSRDTGIKA